MLESKQQVEVILTTQQEEVIGIQEDSEEIVTIKPGASVNSTSTMTTKISFGFTRQTKQTVVSSTNSSFIPRVENENHEEEEEGQRAQKRGVLSLENGVIIDAEPTKKKEKKNYVINVKKTTNDWRIERLKKIIEEGTATDEDKARYALLLEAINPENTMNEASVPMQGKNSQNNVTVLPSKADDMVDPDYNEIPVGEFGLAFLRGCGWKETAGIGKSNKKAVPLRISEPRPKGLGLGASISLPPSGKDKEKKGSEKAQQNGHGSTPFSVKNQQEMEEIKPLGKRSYVKCLGGLNKDAIGEVISMDEENASVFVELSWPPKSCGKTVRMNQAQVQVISSREYKEKVKKSETAEPTKIQSNDRDKDREYRKSRDEKDKKRKRSRDRDSRRSDTKRIRTPS